MITSVRLVDGLREMSLYPREGIEPGSLDVGFPDVREVVEPRADDDGDNDSTSLFGSRAVSLDMVVYEEPYQISRLVDELKSFLHPRTRPYLYVGDDGWDQERRVRLRVSQFTEPYTGYVSAVQRSVQAQWKAPDGIWESADVTEVTVRADIVSTVGISFPASFPISFTATQASGASEVSNDGGVPAHFTARLYGPCTGPRLVNETTGEEIRFTSSLTLAPGEYVEVNTRDRSAFLLSMASQSRLNALDFAVTSWWRVEPGQQQVRYAPLGASDGAAAAIEYRAAWL
ncbi:MAG: hypothetical protein JWO67_7197 [Streptosporangiaceae bacterium]|nr:hypothetical protein [Streptosporangiaceae bacterium]